MLQIALANRCGMPVEQPEYCSHGGGVICDDAAYDPGLESHSALFVREIIVFRSRKKLSKNRKVQSVGRKFFYVCGVMDKKGLGAPRYGSPGVPLHNNEFDIRGYWDARARSMRSDIWK